MKFRVIRASRDLDEHKGISPTPSAVQDGDEWFVELPTIEALMALRKEAGADLIIGSMRQQPDIWIYDDYME